MTVWLIRGGRHGEREDFALEKKVAIIGWEYLPDLSTLQSRDVLSALFAEKYPDEKPLTRGNWVGSVWPFVKEMKAGDLVVMPLKNRGRIAIGKIVGEYQYQPNNPGNSKHARPVDWLNEISRNQVDADLLASMGAMRTVCRINVIDADKRIIELLRNGGGQTSGSGTLEEENIDYEQLARDQISSTISRKFRGHDLERLVAAVLEAQGYKVRVSPEGADGGVDIIAGRGPLGFEPPRLVVQVKSGDSPVDVNVMRQLTGVMSNFGADSGLIVAWGGYRGVVEKENARQFFKIRLWDADTLVKMIQEYYDQLSPDIQAELPLKRIWILVPEDEE